MLAVLVVSLFLLFPIVAVLVAMQSPKTEAVDHLVFFEPKDQLYVVQGGKVVPLTDDNTPEEGSVVYMRRDNGTYFALEVS